MKYSVCIETQSHVLWYFRGIIMSRMRSTICLFRNDLRVHDNKVLLTAQKTGDFVLPLYCFDPDHFKVYLYFVLKMSLTSTLSGDMAFQFRQDWGPSY